VNRLRLLARTRARSVVLALAVVAAAPVGTPADVLFGLRPVSSAVVSSVLPVSPACASVTVPAYFYAGPTWDAASSGPASVTRTLILNPSSGPGDQVDPAYLEAVDQARASAARVIGYVHTSYGERSREAVLDDVARYGSWYGVVDVFFDEVSSSVEDLSYYRALSEQVRGAGGLVVLNPGVHPDEGYMALADQVVTFEGDYDSYRHAQPPDWTSRYAPDRFTHLVYGTTKRQLRTALQLSSQRRAGNVYVTDDRLDNPWDTLPSYWRTELDVLAARC
jgi:hypothetical protein